MQIKLYNSQLSLQKKRGNLKKKEKRELKFCFKND